jgi:PBP1b-binding outer membrane lipoprotein LpoB
MFLTRQPMKADDAAMKRTAVIAVALILAVAGCSRGSKSAKATPAEPQPLPDPMTVPVNPKMAPIDPAMMRVDEQMLTFMAKHFAHYKKRPPFNIEELVKAHYLARVPVPPPGTRYFVDMSSVSVTLTQD